MITITDQLGNSFKQTKEFRRVVSLVPSITEYLIDLGVEVVGRTKFCIHPSGQVDKIPIIGGTKNVHLEAIVKLDPDIIIANKEENEKLVIEKLKELFPVWVSDISGVDDAINMMIELGILLDRRTKSIDFVSDLERKLKKIKSVRSGSVLYFIWRDPWMVAGKGTYIDQMLQIMGYSNLMTRERYPELSGFEIKSMMPDNVLLSSEPFPFSKHHFEELTEIFPDATIELVNGELYSWYGTRLIKLIQ